MDNRRRPIFALSASYESQIHQLPGSRGGAQAR